MSLKSRLIAIEQKSEKAGFLPVWNEYFTDHEQVEFYELFI